MRVKKPQRPTLCDAEKETPRDRPGCKGVEGCEYQSSE